LWHGTETRSFSNGCVCQQQADAGALHTSASLSWLPPAQGSTVHHSLPVWLHLLFVLPNGTLQASNHAYNILKVSPARRTSMLALWRTELQQLGIYIIQRLATSSFPGFNQHATSPASGVEPLSCLPPYSMSALPRCPGRCRSSFLTEPLSARILHPGLYICNFGMLPLSGLQSGQPDAQ
jgi:hypothetical protein